MMFDTSRDAEAEEVLREIAKRNGVELVDIIIVPEEASTALGNVFLCWSCQT